MSIIIKSKREVALMRESAKIMKGLFPVLKAHTKAGISTWELDKIASSYITSNGGVPSSKGYEGYPGSICISVNDTLIHGIPKKSIILKDGDIVSYDVLITKNGYTVDACRTYPVGEISEVAKKLIEATRNAFFKGVELIKPGIHLGVVSNEIYKVCRSYGFTATKDYTGHGVGSDVHEDPYIPNVGKVTDGPILEEGMTLAIEPMFNEGKVGLYVEDDGWTVKTEDGKLSCHYENTVVVTATGYEILTLDKGEEI